VANTWARREQPILLAIAQLSENGVNPSKQDLVSATGLAEAVVGVGLRNLYESDYLAESQNITTFGPEGFDLAEIRLAERGYLATGLWPSDPYDELLEVLTEAIRTAKNAADKTKLETLRDALGAIGQGVTVELLTALIAKGVRLS
jgi:hypothetical protein